MKYIDIATLARCGSAAAGSARREGGALVPAIRIAPTAPHVPSAPGAPPTRRINSFLDNVDVGDLIVRGDLEAYSCECPSSSGWGAPWTLGRPLGLPGRRPCLRPLWPTYPCARLQASWPA